MVRVSQTVFSRLIPVLALMLMLVSSEPALALDNLEVEQELALAAQSPVVINDGAELATTRLHQAWAATREEPGLVRFSLNGPQKVSIGVYDARGNLVQEIIEKTMTGGVHAARWAGEQNGSYVLLSCEQGVFLKRLQR